MNLFRTCLVLTALLTGDMVHNLNLARAQSAPRQPNAAELLRAIERLAVVGNVLYVAAHPDDENTKLLAYLGRERLLRTAYLSLTRGDGGQNLLGAEQGALLGLIRTQELLAARRLDGAEQFFTRARDFGYSKTADETLAVWNKDEVLSDMVRIIRSFAPDIIITRFSTQGGDTHGHHTASAILAQQAFAAAADARIFPEQLKHLDVWQAQRLYWNRSLWGAKPGDDLSGFIKLDIGGYSPLLGASYGEIAGQSRSMHKSQGFGAALSRGPSLEYFRPLLSSAQSGAGDADILGQFDYTWRRISQGGRLADLLAQAQRIYNPRRPADSIPLLLAARSEMLALPKNPWQGPKLAELNEVIAACAGLFLEATADAHSSVPGGSLQVTATALNRSSAPLRLREVRLSGRGRLDKDVVIAAEKPLVAQQAWQGEHAVTVAKSAAISNPYWLLDGKTPTAGGMYTVSQPELIGEPQNLPTLQAEFGISFGDSQERLELLRPVAYKWVDPVAGERYRPIEIAPPIMLNPDSSVLMFADGQPRPLRVRVQSGIDQAAGSVRLELPAGFVAEPAAIPFHIDKKGAEEEVRFMIRLGPGTAAAPPTSMLRVVAEVGGEQFLRGITQVDYPHIPVQTVYPLAQVKLCRLDLKKTRTRIGYIVGAGDDVPAALRQVGYEVNLLGEQALASQPLGQYGAIVVGVRAYNTNPRLTAYYKRLMDYVAGGGNLIVQYNTNNRLSKLNTAIGPYPFEISQDRVTEENAAVHFLLPNHPLLQRPNRISDADFSDWIQERGLYFADKWNEKYETPLSMHDTGEPAKNGSVLVARHGKGAFIYTGLAFFRQLPAGVSGAYRLFANMISYGQ